VDLEGALNAHREKYKGKLGVNARAAVQKKDEVRSSFSSLILSYLLRLKKQGNLPPYAQRVGMLGYWEDKVTKKRKSLLVVRQDGYVVDEQGHKLTLKGFGLEAKFAGRLMWLGKGGRLEVYRDETKNAWYASIPVEVGVETKKRVTGQKSSTAIRVQYKSNPPKVKKVASADLGINVLASALVGDGTWLLYKGVRTEEDHSYLERRRIAEV